jgi:hypothetical protein
MTRCENGNQPTIVHPHHLIYEAQTEAQHQTAPTTHPQVDTLDFAAGE